MNTQAERLIEARGDLSQEALAARAGVSQALIAALETGRQATSGLLPEIAYALGLQAMWLKTGLGPKEIYPELRTVAPPLTLAAPHQVNQQEAQRYSSNVVPLPKSTPLIDELNRVAARMSERGLQVLIYEADKIDKLYPQAQANPAS